MTPTGKPCGNCTMCCKLFQLTLPEFIYNKPAQAWCKFCRPGQGCSIYATSPQLCQEYLCLFRQTDIPDEFRPDRCHVIFEMNATNTLLVARVDPNYPDALTTPTMVKFMAGIARDIPIYVIVGDKRWIYGYESDPKMLEFVEGTIRPV